MRGLSGKVGPGNRPASEEQREAFAARHGDLITWLVESLPRIGGRRCPAPVGGVVGKCALFHGRDKIEGLVTALRTGDFDGLEDPAHVLWRWLMEHNTRQFKTTYGITVTACRAYMEGRKVKMGSLTPARTDIFDWNDDFTEMIPPKGRKRAEPND